MKRTSSSKELTPTFLLLLPSIEIKHTFFVCFPIFFLSGLGAKRSFDKELDLDYRSLASDWSRKRVDISFAGCQCSQAVKKNKVWQLELLNNKTICMIEAIPLVAAIFWDLNFVLYSRYIFNLARKLGLKTKRLKVIVLNRWMGQIWANKIIEELNLLFRNNPEWFHSIAIIFL